MNFIEGKVEWHGNGVVVIKERSVMRAIWRFVVHGERQLHSAIRYALCLSKNLFSQPVLNTEGLDTSVSKKKFRSMNPSAQMTSLSQQAQVITREPIAVETKKYPSWPKVRPMGTLTEIRRYAGNGHAASVANGDELSALQQLLPALAGFCHDRWLVLVSPPQRPNVAELTAAGIDPSRVLLVHARGSQGLRSNGLKVVEKALQSGTCGAVVAWLEECDAPTLQQLRCAAVAGHAWGVMFREDGTEQTIAYKTREPISSLPLSAIMPMNDGMRETTTYTSNAESANTSKVVNIHSDSTKERVSQQKDVTQLEMAMS